MEEIVKNKNTKAVLSGLITFGIVATGFYFVFLRGGGLFGQSNLGRGQSGSPDIDMTPYEGQKKFLGKDNDPNNYVQGFAMPDSIDNVRWGGDGDKVSVITKPDSPKLFDSIEPKSMIQIWRSSEDTVSCQTRNGVEIEYYDEIANYMVLARNTYLIN